MKEIKLSIPDDVSIVSITIVSSLDGSNTTWVKVEAFSASENEHEIDWNDRNEQDGGAE